MMSLLSIQTIPAPARGAGGDPMPKTPTKASLKT
jgi:hypothetical protein